MIIRIEENFSSVLYFSDVHATTRAPSKRLDDFPESLLEKIQEVSYLAHQHNSLLICGGDLFHLWRINLRYADRIIEILDKHTLICIPGNHDLMNNSLQTFDQTLLAHYARHEKLFVSNEPEVYSIKINGTEVEIHALPYQHNVDITNYSPPENSNEEAFRILMVHGMLLPKPAIFRHVLIPEFDSGGMNLVLIGHYHGKINSCQTKDGAIAIGSGSLSRLAMYGDDLVRQPHVILIDPEEGKVKRIPLSSAKNPKEIFDMEEMKKLKESSIDISEFLSKVSGSQIETVNVRDEILNFAPQMEGGRDQEVLDYIFKIMEQVGTEN